MAKVNSATETKTGRYCSCKQQLAETTAGREEGSWWVGGWGIKHE
jgi:hypothetical protein